MAVVAGNTIASLPTATSIDIDIDSFLVSTRDKYLCGVYDSKNASAVDMLQYLTTSIHKSLGLSSMAKHSADEYSLIEHSHDGVYNKLDLQYVYPNHFPDGYPRVSVDQSIVAEYAFDGYPIVKPQITSSLSIGNMFNDGLLSTLYIPMSCAVDVVLIPWGMVEPPLGEIRFAALDDITSIDAEDVKSDDFDGWLWLKSGIDYRLDDFRRADELIDSNGNVLVGFIKSYNASNRTFQLKDGSYFVKLDNTNAPLQTTSGKTELMRHNHRIYAKADGVVSALGEIDVSRLAGDGGKFHSGRGVSDYKPKKPGYTYEVNSRHQISSLVEKKDGVPTGRSWRDIWADETCCPPNGNRITFSKIQISADITIQLDNDSSVIQNSAVAGETYPTHNLMPIQVYVGRKKGTV